MKVLARLENTVVVAPEKDCDITDVSSVIPEGYSLRSITWMDGDTWVLSYSPIGSDDAVSILTLRRELQVAKKKSYHYDASFDKCKLLASVGFIVAGAWAIFH